MQLINKKKNYKFKPFNALKFKYTRSYNKLQILHFLVFLAGVRLKKLLTKYYLLLSTLILFPYIKSFLRNKY